MAPALREALKRGRFTAGGLQVALGTEPDGSPGTAPVFDRMLAQDDRGRAGAAVPARAGGGRRAAQSRRWPRRTWTTWWTPGSSSAAARVWPARSASRRSRACCWPTTPIRSPTRTRHRDRAELRRPHAGFADPAAAGGPRARHRNRLRRAGAPRRHPLRQRRGHRRERARAGVHAAGRCAQRPRQRGDARRQLLRSRGGRGVRPDRLQPAVRDLTRLGAGLPRRRAGGRRGVAHRGAGRRRPPRAPTALAVVLCNWVRAPFQPWAAPSARLALRQRRATPCCCIT